MRIVLELYDTRYIIESTDPGQNDFDANELKSFFSRLLVGAGFSPSVLDDQYDGGKWEFVEPDEIVVKREEM